MGFARCVIIAVLAAGLANRAEARRDPEPKPSGIVVHLFGPGSIVAGIVPDLPGESARPATAGAAPPPARTAAGSPAPRGIPAADAAEAPSLGAVLHQMFVAGDPAHPNTPSAGRSAERPRSSEP